MLTIDYQMTVYKPDDTTILTPQHPSAPHSDQFIVTTATNWSGQQIMENPRGREGQLDVLTGVTDTGALTIRLVDKKLSTTNISRWVTAFVGNATNVSDLIGLKVLIKQRVTDASGTTTADWFTGRIDDIKLGRKKNVVELRIRDMADDLGYTIFTGMILGENNQYLMKAPPEENSLEDAYVSYGKRPALAPIGLPDRSNRNGGTKGYGGFITQRWMKGLYKEDVDGKGYIELDREWTPLYLRTITGAWPGVSENPRLMGRGVVSNPYLRVRVQRASDSTYGEFHWGVRSVEGVDLTDLSSILEAFRNNASTEDGELALIPLVDLNSDDGDYKAQSVYTIDETLYCYVYSIADPTEAAPIYIDDVHPGQLFADILDGKWGMIQIDGTVRRSFPRDSTSFTTLIADATIPISRWIIKEPAKLNEWVEENICKPYQIGYRLNGSGQVVVFRTTRPTSASVAGAPTINSDDVVADGSSGWEQTRDDAVNLLIFKSYSEVGPRANLQGATSNPLAEVIKRMLEGMGLDNPEYLTPVVEAENTITYLLSQSADLRNRTPKKHEIDLKGLHTGFDRFEINFFGVKLVWSEAARAWADRHKETVKALFSYGPVYYNVTCLRTTATKDVYPGDWVLAAIPDQMDPANAKRGGTRAALCTKREDDGLHIRFQFLDGGPNASATAPSLNALTLGTDTNHWVNVPIDYSGFGSGNYRVVVEYALTDTATGTRPVEGSSAWRYALNHTDVAAAGVVTKTVKRMPSNTRVWVRARTEPSDLSALPSAWVFPSGSGYIDTAAYTAPSAIAVDTSTYGGGIVAFTVTLGDSSLDTVIELAKSTCPAGSYETIHRMEKGDTFYILAGTAVSSTYCVRAYHVDQYGGETAGTTQQFTTAATKKTAPVMADVSVVFGE